MQIMYADGERKNDTQADIITIHTTHMQTSSQFRKPSTSLKQTRPMYITSPACMPIGCTSQEVDSLHYIKFTTTYIHSIIIHTTHNFKWSRNTLTTPNISQFQTCIYLLETAHPRTTKQLTRHTTLHTVHHKHTKPSPHRICVWHSYTEYN